MNLSDVRGTKLPAVSRRRLISISFHCLLEHICVSETLNAEGPFADANIVVDAGSVSRYRHRLSYSRTLKFSLNGNHHFKRWPQSSVWVFGSFPGSVSSLLAPTKFPPVPESRSATANENILQLRHKEGSSFLFKVNFDSDSQRNRQKSPCRVDLYQKATVDWPIKEKINLRDGTRSEERQHNCPRPPCFVWVSGCSCVSPVTAENLWICFLVDSLFSSICPENIASFPRPPLHPFRIRNFRSVNSGCMWHLQ